MTDIDDKSSSTTRRRARRSGDEVLMSRKPTYGAGLNELETMINEFEDVNQDGAPSKAKPGAVSGQSGGSSLLTTLLVAAVAVLVGLVNYRPSTCEDTCATSADGICDDTGPGSQGGTCAFGSDCSDCGVRDFLIPHWALLLASLVTTALLVLGTATVQEMAQLAKAQMLATTSWLRIPLTDVHLSIESVNKMANSTQVREKGLKILQYVLRATAYSKFFSKEVTASAKALSKTTSIARRFFKFARWVKHFEDLSEAQEQKSLFMKACLYFRIAANFGADWAEDVCSLERVGLLPKGTLSVEFMLFAEFCQLALALVEIFVTTVRARKEKEVEKLSIASGVTGDKLLKQKRKLALVRLELIKFVSDVGKALQDCELSIAHEGIFISCSLFSAILSTHKNMVKIFK